MLQVRTKRGRKKGASTSNPNIAAGSDEKGGGKGPQPPNGLLGRDQRPSWRPLAKVKVGGMDGGGEEALHFLFFT